jgi:benzoyl-CoA reductase/2-hydroxyglutaryl-CoA dehydratase subunit BcrC/BadD/HgdB
MDTPTRLKIAATGQMKNIMADYFRDLDGAAKDPERKVAWCTSVGPAELLRAMGFAVHFPENHAAMLGSTRMTRETIPVANAAGYSPDICSYLTADVGSYLSGKTPLKRAFDMEVPRPDVLVFNTNQCRDVQDWFSWYGRELGVPVVGVASPSNVTELSTAHFDCVSEQIEELVPTLEAVAGERLDIDRLREVVGRSLRCSELWKEVLELCTSRPSPWTFFDHTIHMGPAVVLRGEHTAIDYYEALLAEMRARLDQGVGAIEGERHRVYWEGMPIWGKLRDLSEQFAQLRTAIPVSTYCNSWIFTDFDPADPFDSMARAYTSIFICRSEQPKQAYIADACERFGIDGIVFHDAKTCPNNSNNRYGMPGRLEQQLGIPTLTIDGDLNDLRLYSEEQSRTAIQAFVEGLEE